VEAAQVLPGSDLTSPVAIGVVARLAIGSVLAFTVALLALPPVIAVLILAGRIS